MPKRSGSNLPSAQAEDYSSSNPHLGLLHSMLKKKTRVHVHTHICTHMEQFSLVCTI